MGINDFLVEDYRVSISNRILNNPLLVAVLSNDEILDVEESDSLIDTHLKAQHYIPDVIEETGSYIMFDLDEIPQYPRDSKVTVYTEVRLYFWLITHKKMARYKTSLTEQPYFSAKNMYRNDIMAREIKNMFEYKDNLGTSPNHLIHNKMFPPENKDYYGRFLMFTITDLSDKVRLKYVQK